MKIAAWCLIILAIPLAGFAVWGVYTVAGQRRFDEMSGMIPMFAGGVAIVTVLLAAVLFYFSR